MVDDAQNEAIAAQSATDNFRKKLEKRNIDKNKGWSEGKIEDLAEEKLSRILSRADKSNRPMSK